MWSRLERLRPERYGWLLAAPAVLAVLSVILYPVFSGIWMSFQDLDLLRGATGRFVGFSNYRGLASDPFFWVALENTFVWAAGNVVVQTALGLAAALFLNRAFRGRGFLRSVALIPWVIPSVVAVLTWRWMYDWNSGLFNAILVRLGVLQEPVLWLGNVETAMPSVLVESIWKGSPFVMVILLAALQAIPTELREAAAVDGAGPVQSFLRVTLPQIRRSLALAVVLTTVYSVNNFNAIWLMTEGGPIHSTEILFTYAYKAAFRQFDFGAAGAISVILLLALALFGGLYLTLVDLERPRRWRRSP